MQRIHVMYEANGTIHNDWFTASHSSLNGFEGGRFSMSLTDGEEVDSGRKVLSVQYALAPRVIRYED